MLHIHKNTSRGNDLINTGAAHSIGRPHLSRDIFPNTNPTHHDIPTAGWRGHPRFGAVSTKKLGGEIVADSIAKCGNHPVGRYNRQGRKANVGAGTATATEPTREHKQYATQGPTTYLCT